MSHGLAIWTRGPYFAVTREERVRAPGMGFFLYNPGERHVTTGVLAH